MSTEPTKKIELTLDLETTNHSAEQAVPEKQPVMGWIAVACGIIGIFTMSIIFVPLGLVCSIAAVFMGQGLWGFFGIVLAVLGFLTSPTLLGIVGLSALIAYFGI